jgi:hypothetical protein
MGEYKLLKIAPFHGIRKSVFLEIIVETAAVRAVALSGTLLLLRVGGDGPY